MSNQNGQLILKALQDLDQPVTVAKLVSHVAQTAGVHPNDVEDSVKETLQGGLQYGFVQKNHSKYYAADVDSLSDADLGKMSDSTEGEMEDRGRRSGRRRRGSRRRGSRRRSRSRRRR